MIKEGQAGAVTGRRTHPRVFLTISQLLTGKPGGMKMSQPTFALTDHELEPLRSRCRGAPWAAPPSGINRKPFLIRLLKDVCPIAAAKIEHMTTDQVEFLCACLAPRLAPGSRGGDLLTEAGRRATRTPALAPLLA
jgi:hypothetical protein